MSPSASRVPLGSDTEQPQPRTCLPSQALPGTRLSLERGLESKSRYLPLTALAPEAQEQKLFMLFKHGASPAGPSFPPLAGLARCLAGIFECFHVIPNGSEDFCNVFHYYYHTHKNKKKNTGKKPLVKQAWKSPAPQNSRFKANSKLSPSS